MSDKLTLIAIIIVHLISDFILQTDEMAKGKSKSNKWLTIHVLVYTFPFFIFGWKFAILNGAFHFVTDYLTSRLSSKMWSQNRVHDFFVVIGADQALHMIVLVLSMPLIWWLR